MTVEKNAEEQSQFRRSDRVTHIAGPTLGEGTVARTTKHRVMVFWDGITEHRPWRLHEAKYLRLVGRGVPDEG
jgi:hypothetical protein